MRGVSNRIRHVGAMFVILAVINAPVVAGSAFTGERVLRALVLWFQSGLSVPGG